MALLPAPLERLILALERLPGIGPKTASRLAFYFLNAPDAYAVDLSQSLAELKAQTAVCETCFNIMEAGRKECQICTDEKRDRSVLCVVEDALDVLALEKTVGYFGLYHVLNGALSPIEGIGPDDIRVKELEDRVSLGDIKEVIVATNPSMEGDATALYIRQRLERYPVTLTRLARGLPVGGDLEYADQNTLLRALAGRQSL